MFSSLTAEMSPSARLAPTILLGLRNTLLMKKAFEDLDLSSAKKRTLKRVALCLSVCFLFLLSQGAIVLYMGPR